MIRKRCIPAGKIRRVGATFRDSANQDDAISRRRWSDMRWHRAGLRCAAARHLLLNATMARIRTAQRRSTTVVTVSGCLCGRDMRRLEHACSPALTTARMQLTVDLTRVTELDRVAEMLLQRMAARGAQIVADRRFRDAED